MGFCCYILTDNHFKSEASCVYEYSPWKRRQGCKVCRNRHALDFYLALVPGTWVTTGKVRCLDMPPETDEGVLWQPPSSMPQQIVNIHLGGRRQEERETRNSYSTFWCFPYTWAAPPSVLSWPTAKVLLYISAQGLFSAWLTRHSFQYLPFIQYWLTRNHLLFSIFNSQPNNFLVCKTHSDVQQQS